MSLDSDVYIGIITSAHGIKGQVKIKTFTENPKDVSSFKKIFDQFGNPLNIKIHSVKSGFVIASVEGVADRNQAEALRDVKLYIPRSALPEPSENEYYHQDLIGLEVHYTNGAVAGKVKAIENFGAGDVMEIADRGKSFYYPFNRNFVQDVSLEKGLVIVELLEEIPMIEQRCFVVAVDGPSAAGKGTIAKELADRLGFAYLDTGMMYRVLACNAVAKEVALDDVKALVKLASELNYDEAKADYKSEEVGAAASRVAQIPEVRKVLNRIQKKFPAGKVGVVVDGRDIGSVIFPEAPCKFYITASLEVRSQRRFAQMQKDDPSLTLGQVKEKLQERDKRDTMRSVSPLVISGDAVVIDTSALTIEESCEQAYDMALLAMENVRS